MNLKEALELRKAKYIKRWKDKDGKWQYQYKEPSKAERKFITRRELTYRGEKFGLSAIVDELTKELRQPPKAVPKRILSEVARLMRKDKSEGSYHWLRGFMSPDKRTYASTKKAKAMFQEMKNRKIL